MADYFPLLSRTIASLGNSTPEQRQIVYERARSVVADQLSAIEPPMDSDAIKRELSLFEACVMRLEHDMNTLEAIKPPEPPPVSETRKQISARLSDLLAKAAAARAAATQELLTREIEPSTAGETDFPTQNRTSAALTASRPAVDSVPEPVSRPVPRVSSPPLPQVTERKPLIREEARPAPEDHSAPEPARIDKSAEEEATEAGTPQVGTSGVGDTLAPVDGNEGGLTSSVDVPAVSEPVAPERDAESRFAVPADADAGGTNGNGVFDNPSISGGPAEMPAVPDLPKSSWLFKVQDVWQKKAPVIATGEEASASVEPAPFEPLQPVASGPLTDEPPQSRVLALEEPLQPALTGTIADEDFVGPVMPVSEAASSEIVFSDDSTPADPVDQPDGLPLAQPLKPPPASEIELQDDGRPRLAQRRKRDRSLFRGIVMGVAFISVIAAVAGTAWVLRDRPADFEQGATVTRGDLSRKITDRLPSEAVAVAASGADQGAGGASLALSGQRVTVFEEAIEGQPEPVPVQGRVTWALETVRDQTGAGDVAIKAEIKGLTGSLSGAGLVIKRNRDPAFPASHLIELAFATPENSPAGRVRDIGTPEMRAEEGVRGTSLSGLPVPVTENVFLVGLTNLPDRIEQNRELLRTRNWIVIPMRFANGRRAVMMLEKGLVGDRVLLDAFQAWK